MICTFSSDTDLAISPWVMRIKARTNMWDMTAEHAFSCCGDELQRSVNESGHLDNAKHIAS
jgi:hypothetical protein